MLKNLYKNIIRVRFCCQCPAVKLMNASPSTEAVKMRLLFYVELWKKLPCMRFDNQRWRHKAVSALVLVSLTAKNREQQMEIRKVFHVLCGWLGMEPTIVMHVNNKMNKSTFYGLLTSDINLRGCFFRPLAELPHILTNSRFQFAFSCFRNCRRLWCAIFSMAFYWLFSTIWLISCEVVYGL